MINSRYAKSQALLDRALKTIPLASQTFSKSLIQYPSGVSPLFIKRGQGSHVWDVDENEYVDFVSALAAVSIGYNDSDINAAVLAQMQNGIIFSLPHPLEVEVAELLVELVPCAEMVRFGKNGTDATSAAIRLARAYTKKEHVLVCGYHGWQDWYIGSTARGLGVPESVKNLTHTFKYNDIQSLEEWFKKYPDDIAAVIMEPMNFAWPKENFLQSVKNLTHKYKSILVFDETITGCRYAKGGAQELFNVTPDLTVFGKGLANGFPLSAIMGQARIMSLMEDIFFSGTFGGETLSLAAAKVVLEKIKSQDVLQKIHNTGDKVFTGVKSLISKHDVGMFIEIGGHPSWSMLSIKDTKVYSNWVIRTLYLQEMFKRGILTIGSHNINYAHNDDDVKKLLNAYDEVFKILFEAVNENRMDAFLEAKPLEPLFKVR